MSTYLQAVRKYEAWVFLSLIVVVNAIFVTGIVQGILPKGLYSHGRFYLLASVLFILVYLLRGVRGVWDILHPMLEWRRSPLLYLFAFGWTLALCLIVLFFKGLITGNHLTLEKVAAGWNHIAHPQLFLTIVLSSFAGEMVWISYAVRTLSKKFTHYVSGLIVGLFWTLWWLPMSIYNFGIIKDLPLLALLFNQSGIAAMCAFVYFHTRSGLLVLVMQIVFNSTILVFPVTPEAGGAGTYWAFALTYFSAATLLFLRFGPGPLLFASPASGKRTPAAAGSLLKAGSEAGGRRSGVGGLHSR